MSETNSTEPSSDFTTTKRGRPKGSKNKVRLVDTINCHPLGDKIFISERMKQKASEEDCRRYAEILTTVHENIATAQNALHQLGENLAIIQRDRLYYAGGYETFSEFCRVEIGSRTRAYRLLDAREVIENLLASGFTEVELPDKERLCRAIVKLSPIDQAKVWKQVLKHKEETGKEPTGGDVERAARELNNGESERDSAQNPERNKDRDEQQSEKLITDWGTAAKKFKVGLSLATLTPPTRLRLAAILSEVQDNIKQLMATLAHYKQQEEADPESTGGGRS